MTKLCVFCKHFELDLGESDISENTPGYNGFMYCSKKHFEYTEGAIDYRNIILQAENCKDYKRYNNRDEEYSEEQPSEIIQPAIRKLDLDD